MDKGGKATLADIAAATGVSKTTVSRYINGHGELMSAETRKKISQAIESMNFQPSELARNLKNRRTNLIGVLMSDLSSPFSSTLVIAIGKYLTDHGYTPLFVHSGNSYEQEVKDIDMLLSKGVEGLIVNTTAYDNPNLIRVAKSGVPIVLCDRYIKDYSLDIVTVGHKKAALEIVNHLKEQGYTKPILFTQPWENNSSRMNRKNAICEAVHNVFGTDMTENDIYIIDDENENSVRELLEKMRSQLKPEDIPVILGINSVTTVRVLKETKTMGMKIPQQIGICGPEDWDWKNDLAWPTLSDPAITTFSQPTNQMGSITAKLMLEVIERGDEQAYPQEIVLPCKLNVRASTQRSVPQSVLCKNKCCPLNANYQGKSKT